MGIRKSQAPTLVDVARAASVSLKTASRVLNNTGNVSEKKVARIQAVMTRLGYRPNELARGLKSRKSSAIGMIVANLANPLLIVNVMQGCSGDGALQQVRRFHRQFRRRRGCGAVGD